MKSDFRIDKLEKLLKSFFVLTKVRIVIFDNNFKEIVSYPQTDCDFCKYIRQDKEIEKKCLKSNLEAFKHCYQSDELYIYKCHAGLIEAMMHLRVKDTIVGYIMFGQISDIEDDNLRFKNIVSHNNLDQNDKNIKEIISKIKYLCEEELFASKTILLTLAKYTISERLVFLQKEQFTNDLDNYLEEHISEGNIRVKELARVMHMSRTSLYIASEKYLGMGLARYIKLYRLEKAKTLLLDGDEQVDDIAYNVGFNDYNYFCRVFKREVGKSPKEFKKEFNQ